MLFYDLKFIPFFLCIWLLTFFCNRMKWIKYRNLILLIASYYFYAQFSISYVSILAFVTLINYNASNLLLKNKRKWIITTAIILSVLPLAFYKYTKFVTNLFIPEENLTWCSWILPVGISFYTFQAMTYTIDVYRGKITEKTSIINYALFVAFFPNILSGPIERARNFLPQLKEICIINSYKILSGFQLFCWGLFKKIVIADRMNVYTSSVFAHPDFYTGNSNILAIFIYSIQLYADFSGYSDMAIGIARMLGFELKVNFSFPFFSTSLKSFWRKWHISLTSWFTEYLYIACGGSRVIKWRWYFNLSLVFIVSGIWHGANLTYIVWGILHALLYILEIMLKQNKTDVSFTPLESYIRGGIIFILWALTLCVFRAESLGDAWNMIIRAITSWGTLYKGASITSFVIMIVSLIIFIIMEILVYKGKINIIQNTEKSFSKWNLSFLVIIILIICLIGKSGAEFVYFKF